MIPYGKQSIDKKDIQSVVDVLRSDFLTTGPTVEMFERAIASYVGAKYAVACSNGTTALHLAYLAAGIGSGDEVITTPNTFVATSNMLLVIGARPVFADIRMDTYNIDESRIETLITKKTKAITCVDFAGQACEMAALRRIAKRHDLVLIEDASHSFGGSQRGKKIGTLADMTIFSFHPVKPFTTGEGGAIVTNNKVWYEKMKLLRQHGIHKDRHGRNVMTTLGFNYRMTDMQAALGLSQLKKIDRFIGARNRVAKRYATLLKDIPSLALPRVLPHNYSGWHLYIIRVPTLRQRDRLSEYLKKKGVGVNFHYPAVYRQPYYRKHGYARISLDAEEQYWRTCITLPCYPDLKQREIEYICNAIKTFYKKNN